ncbi:unnamed protein product [Laminaria digitata]
MIYKGGSVSKKEVDDYTHAIRRNVIEAMQTLLEALESLGVALRGGDEIIAAKNRVEALTPEDMLTPEIASDVCSLWKDEGMKASDGG